MSWTHVVAYFFGGLFLANFVPHFVAGVSGRPFVSPFANPPFQGLSPPAVNVVWGLVNASVAYALLVGVGNLDLHRVDQVVVSGSGFGLASIVLARKMGRLHGGSS